MSGEDDKQAADAPSVVRSDGEDAAQGYAAAEVQAGSRTPTVEMFRVQVTDPRRAPTMRREDLLKGSGPRAPEQTTLPEAREAGVDAPMARPPTKMQPLHFDAEFLAELRQRGAEGGSNPRAEEGRSGGGEEVREETKSASPWVKEAGAAPIPHSEMPSGHAPPPAPEASRGSAAGGRRRLGKGVVVAGIVAGLALFAVLRATLPRPSGEPVVPAASKAAGTTAMGSTVPGTAASTASNAAEVESSGPAVPEASTAAPVSTGRAPGKIKRPPALEAPHDAAVMTTIPAVTHPAPTSTSGRIAGGEG
jgi:hypothetical protein